MTEFKTLDDGSEYVTLGPASGGHDDSSLATNGDGLWLATPNHGLGFGREMASHIVARLQAWLATGSLRLPTDGEGIDATPGS